jgi:hypothetical protein
LLTASSAHFCSKTVFIKIENDWENDMAQAAFGKTRVFFMVGAAVLSVTLGAALDPAFAQRNKKEQAAQQAKGPSVSKNFQKPLGDIQKLISEKNWEQAKALLVTAREIANPTPYDSFIISNFGFEVARGLNDQQGMYDNLLQMVVSEFTPADNKYPFYNFLTDFNVRNKNWPDALKFAKEMLALKPNEVGTRVTVAAIARQINDFPTAEATLLEGINLSRAAGQKPAEDLFREVAATRQRARSPEFIQAVRDWIAEYPKPENWNTLLFDFQTRAKLGSRQSLDLFRLMVQTGALEGQGEFIEYADAAINSAAPGEAKFALQQGSAAGKINLEEADVKDLLRRADAAIAADLRDAAAFLKSAQSAKNGELMAQVGYAHLSYGENEKAVSALRDALARGGLRNLDEINLRLGIALSNTGDKAGALEALAKVKDNPKLVELAQLWTLYTKVR